MRPRRPAAVLCLALAAALPGCAWPVDADDPVAVPRFEGSPPPIAPVTPAPVPVASATLADLSGGSAYSGTVTVVRTPVSVGLPPLAGPLADDCDLPDDGSVRTLAVELTFTDTSTAAMAGLAADVALTAADGGPPRAGTAVLVGSAAPGTRWCQDGPSPVTDGFGVGSGTGSATTVTVWVVARAGAPTRDLVLRVSGLRNEAGSNATGPWDEVAVAAGGCADDPAALCVPLG
ncbi:hypothetical protein SAMN04488107_2293 [Geodermatophilus saharensis]|uniref:Uncharacterized protein n=1 Tax=Geodermatophilus saharensis TaxID=1137994 RepID=A0A239DQY2_9ACTN|nr:hypothetical protein [Geodermatophilus saharensis]SNS34308.1 hypothetical protein SAMN04488107_2293 [Geodermatophilus saharensis]